MTAFQYQYPHHEAAVQKLLDYFQDDPGVIAVVLGGSVAKGLARPDSDIDAEIIMTPERWRRQADQGVLAECIFGQCAYEGGYFDLKYYTKEFLKAAAERGSEPARNAFLKARCVMSKDPEIPEIVARIPVFQKREKAEKMLSFYAKLELNAGYFWDSSRNLPHLRLQAVANIHLFAWRLFLEDREILFPCVKSMMIAVNGAPDLPPGLMEKSDAFLENPGDETKRAFIEGILSAVSYTPPANEVVLTAFVDNEELWWYRPRPFIAEW